MAMIGILAFIIPIAIVVLIIMAIVRIVRRDKSEDNFQSVIRTMYIYLVMIILLGTLVTSTVMIFNSTIELVLPDIQEDTSTYYINQATRDRNQHISDFTTSATMLLISVPMFAYYSRLAKEDRKKEEESEAKTEPQVVK